MATAYQAIVPSIELIERGRSTVVTCALRLSGAAVTTTAATLTVYDRAGSVVVSPTATVASNVASATVTGATTTSLQPDDRWRLVWSLTVTGEAAEIVVEVAAALVLHRLYPTITDSDLAAALPSLDTSATTRLTTHSHYQAQIAEIDRRVQQRLWEHGRRPWQVLNAGALRETWLHGVCALILDDLAVRDADMYTQRAADYWRRHDAALSRALLLVDWDDTGTPTTEPVSARQSGVWMV